MTPIHGRSTLSFQWNTKRKAILKEELKQSGNRHARKLIRKLTEGGIDLPELAHDSIRQEFEYATLDGYRITMRHLSETETDNDENFNR